MTEIETEIDLRGALRRRARSRNLGTLGRELGIGTAALESFAYGGGTLAPAALRALAANLFRHAGTARMVVKAED